MKELIVVPSIFALLTTFQVFAQNAGDKVDASIATLVGNVGIMGVLIWHLYWTTTRTYPDMLAKFQSETALMRDAFHEEQAELRGVFDREQRSMRDQHTRELAEMRTLIVTVSENARKAVHDMRDAGQVTLNKVQQVVQAGAVDPRATPKPPGGQG